MPTTRPETIEFVQRAPFRASASRELDHPPGVVFDALAKTEAWPEWFPRLRTAQWTSEPPHGVDSTRVVTVGPATIAERFIAWEPGRRWAFTFESVSAPLARAAVEVADLDDLGSGRTRVTYTLAMEPVLPAALLRPLRGVVSRGLGQGLAGLARHLDEREPDA